MRTDNWLRRLAAVLASLILLIGSASLIARAAQPEIPEGARVHVVSEHVLVYYWEVPTRHGTFEVHTLTKITGWPKNAWGAALTLTPVPFCCGAQDHSIQWRRSEPTAPRLLAELDNGTRYSLSFRYR